MTNTMSRAAAVLLFVVGAAGCTANVDAQSSSTSNCTKACDDTETSCTGMCSDDTCKANCTTTHSNCVMQCTTTTTTTVTTTTDGG